MKKLNYLLILLLLPAFAFVEGPKASKFAAKKVIRRTAMVIIYAHKKVKEGKVYTGNLARAIAHQKFARKLYREGKFHRAVHQARRARQLAVFAIKANKGAEIAEMKFSKEEEGAGKDAPSDTELDKELIAAMPGETSKDEDVINSEPDVDLRNDE